MRNDPYRHSVWLDVLGVVSIVAILLGLVGYLLYSSTERGGGTTAETYQYGDTRLRMMPQHSTTGPEPVEIGGLLASPQSNGGIPGSDSDGLAPAGDNMPAIQRALDRNSIDPGDPSIRIPGRAPSLRSGEIAPVASS